ncbi:MAG: lipid-A-disaccharide synthase [Deltaproteobacteria bacterium RBG_13_49_15]|nr:MAG: lipid-A-disaccharide synthase [Deltaproteobacteria bacterium RBG_13_49_15]
MDTDRQRCIMIIAGEASGDLHASKLVLAMKKKIPGSFFCGIGGSAMKEAGVRIVFDASILAAVGVTESFAKMPVILKGMRSVKHLLRDLMPDLLILVDFPDFNLRVAPTAKKLDIPVLYYISPQIWAWRQGRAAKLKNLVDHLAVILPFEEEFYKKYDIPVTFVGHPLVDDPFLHRDNGDWNRASTEFIGLLPGSREREVERHLPVMLDAARMLLDRRPELGFLVSVAHTVERVTIEGIVTRYGKGVPLELVDQGVKTIFEKAALVMATSGTVTLEAAIYGVPEVIIYKVSPVSYWFGKWLVNVKHIGLANLIAGREIIPELIQKAANPKNIAGICNTLMSDQNYRESMKREFINVRKRLGGPGASERVADIAVGLISAGGD